MLDWLNDGHEIEVVNGRVVKSDIGVYTSNTVEFISSFSDPFCVAKSQKIGIKLVGRNFVDKISLLVHNSLLTLSKTIWDLKK